MSETLTIPAALEGTVLVERRRPGRTNLDEALIPLARSSDLYDLDLGLDFEAADPHAIAADAPFEEEQEGGNSVRGIMLGLLISATLWGVAGAGVFAMLRG